MEVTANINTVEVTKFLKNITSRQKAVIDKGLKRVSNMAVLMITKRTQQGKLPDGGNMKAYASSTVRSRKSEEGKLDLLI